jgi:DnaK suppressor protein
MDEIDRAQENEELFRQDALHRHLAGIQHAEGLGIRGLHPQEGVGPSPRRFCEDCGKLIPPARLRAMPAAVRCIQCQAKKEGRGR